MKKPNQPEKIPMANSQKTRTKNVFSPCRWQTVKNDKEQKIIFYLGVGKQSSSQR
jgi:hypothetical protein